MKGLDSAAAITTIMSRWQDTPLDYGAYYTCSTSAWGCYVTGSSKPTPSYFGLKAFGDIVRYPARTAASADNENVTVLGGRDEAGNMALLVSAPAWEVKWFAKSFICLRKQIPSPSSLVAMLLIRSFCLEM